MKKKSILLSGIFFLFVFIASAQGDKQTMAVQKIGTDELDKQPFAKGKWQFYTNIPNLKYEHQNLKQDDEDQGDQSRFSLDLGTNYFFANNLAIGLELNTDFSKAENGYKSTNNMWMAWANFTYGKQLTDNSDFYARIGAGIGGMKSKYTSLTGPELTEKSNDFGLRAAIGFPLRVEGPVYFTPELFARYKKTDFEDGTATDTRFGVNLKLETYLFCKQMSCDSHSGYSLSNGIYNQGHSYLGITTKGMLAFGNNKIKYDNDLFPEDKEDYSRQKIAAEYMYYILNYFSLGLQVNINNQVDKQKDQGFKSTDFRWGITPMFEVNIPGQSNFAHNIFLRGGYGFGGEKIETTSGSFNNTEKYTSTNFCVGLGYNLFYHKKLSITPMFEYESETVKVKDLDFKDKSSGLGISIGIRKYF